MNFDTFILCRLWTAHDGMGIIQVQILSTIFRYLYPKMTFSANLNLHSITFLMLLYSNVTALHSFNKWCCLWPCIFSLIKFFWLSDKRKYRAQKGKRVGKSWILDVITGQDDMNSTFRHVHDSKNSHLPRWNCGSAAAAFFFRDIVPWLCSLITWVCIKKNCKLLLKFPQNNQKNKCAFSFTNIKQILGVSSVRRPAGGSVTCRPNQRARLTKPRGRRKESAAKISSCWLEILQSQVLPQHFHLPPAWELLHDFPGFIFYFFKHKSKTCIKSG